MAAKKKVAKKTAKKTRKKAGKKTAKRTTSKTESILSKKKTKKPKNPTRLHLDEVEVEMKTVERKRVTYICDSAVDTYEDYLKEIKKKEREINRLQKDVDRKLAPIKKELGIQKIEDRIGKLLNEVDSLEENKGDFLLMILGRLADGCKNKFFRLHERLSVGSVRYKALATEVLCSLLGVKEKTDKFNKEFEKLKQKHGRSRAYEVLIYKNKELLSEAKNEREREVKKAA